MILKLLDLRIISQVFSYSRKCKCAKKTKRSKKTKKTKKTNNTKKTKKTKKTKETKKTNKPVPVKCIEDATCDVLSTEDDCPDGICYEG